MRKPRLLMLDNLLTPLNQGICKYENLEKDLHDAKSTNHIYGIFILGFSEFEYSIRITLEYFLKHFPDKLKLADRNVMLEDELIIQPNYLRNIIDQYLSSLLYSNIEDYMIKVCNILCIEIVDENIIKELNEKSATRNILIHNNLLTNIKYLEKSGDYARVKSVGEFVTVEKDYVYSQLQLLRDITQGLVSKLGDKYNKYTRVNAQKELWGYIFTSDVMKFDDYWDVDEKEDSIYRKECEFEKSLSSSEKLFLGIWQREFSGYSKLLNEGALIGTLSSDGQKKFLYLISTLNELKLFQ